MIFDRVPRTRALARWAGRLAAVLLLLAAGAAGATWWYIESLDLKRVVARVESAVEDVTGRAFTIGGEPQLTLTPLLKLVVRDLTLANMKSGATRPEMLKLGRLEIGISLAPLLEGRRPGLNIVLIEPDLWLEASEQGERNWVFEVATEAALARLREAVAILEEKIVFETARIERATVRFEDRRAGRSMTLAAGKAALIRKNKGDYEFELAGDVNGRAVGFHAGNQVPGSGKLAVRLALGRSVMTGSFEIVRLDPRLQLRAQLDTPVLDLNELLTAPAAAGAERVSGEDDGRLFPAAKLPLELLRALDMEMTLKAERLIVPGPHVMETVHAQLSLANGRLAAERLAFAVGSGRVSGSVRLDASSTETATIAVELNSEKVELDRLVKLVGLHVGVIEGARTEMAIKLASNGDSLRAWMAGLNGRLRIVVGEGRLAAKRTTLEGSVADKAMDVLNPYRASDGGVSIKCAVVNVPVRNGVVTFKDTIAAETDRVAGALTGSVDLGQERLDIVLHSQAVQGRGSADYASAAKITGTMAKPELAVNVEGAAVAGLRIGVAIATVGLSRLAGSVARQAFPAHPCKAALAEAV